MKNLGNLISLTSGTVLVYVVSSTLPVQFAFVFFLFLLSTALFIYMVVSILRDNHTTSKTFDNYYYDDVDIKNTP